ncbi:hypothetical protein ACOMHN_056059 [Nucella lapillus]
MSLSEASAASSDRHSCRRQGQMEPQRSICSLFRQAFLSASGSDVANVCGVDSHIRVLLCFVTSSACQSAKCAPPDGTV